MSEVLERMIKMEEEALKEITQPLPNIAFGYPYGNGFSPEFIGSLTNLLLHEISKPKETRILGSILPKGSCYVDSNRSRIAFQFVNETQDDWLLMIDPDIGFEPTILEQFQNLIVNNSEAKIIAARVNLMNGLPVFYKIDYDRVSHIHQSFPFKGLKEFDLVGTGIIAIHRSVFQKLAKDLGHIHFFNKIVTEEGMCVGDDFSFCMRAGRAGFKIFGAWDIEGIHMKSQACRNAYLLQAQLEIVASGK